MGGGGGGVGGGGGGRWGGGGGGGGAGEGGGGCKLDVCPFCTPMACVLASTPVDWFMHGGERFDIV